MSLFPAERLKVWEPTGFLDELKESGFSADLFEGVESGSGQSAVLHPSSAKQEVLLRLFVEGRSLAPDSVRNALPGSFDELVELGLLLCGEETVTSVLRLRAMSGGIYADDFPARLVTSPEDFVMGVAATTRMVKALVPDRDYGRILDLCCGGGWLALTLKTDDRSVVGSDLNSRALEVARLNGRLNGINDVDWREGPWYEAVEGEQFDLIISNPPFVISPGNQSVALDTDDNRGVLPAVLGGMASRLLPGGYACMLMDWPFDEVEDWSRTPLASFDHEELQILLFEVKRQSPEEYARHWIGQDPRFTEPEAFRAEEKRWVEFLESRGYAGISSGFLVIRKCAGGDEWIMEESREVTTINSKTSGDLARIFAGRTWLEKSDPELLDLQFEVADGLIQSSQSVLTGGKWRVANLKLTSPGLLAYDGHIDQALVHLINGIGEGKTIRELLPDLAAPLEVEPSAITDQVADLARELISFGILLPK